tara:strand:+ start:1885 stop:2115 length:231 start_codon:yes stop_codon:yes gene_type:complete
MEKKETTTHVEDNRMPLPTRSQYHTKQRIEFLEAEVEELQDKFTLLGERYVILLGFFKELCDSFQELQTFQQNIEE